MINESKIAKIDIAYTSRSELINLIIFWIGFIIYSVSYIFSQPGHLNIIVCQAFQSIGILLIIFTVINLIRFKVQNLYLNFIFIIYCIWTLFIIIRGFTFEFTFLKIMLFDGSFGLIPYFVPFILLFPIKLSFLKKTFDVIIILGVFYILYDILFIKDLLNSDHTSWKFTNIVEKSAFLSIPSCFLLLTFRYHAIKKKIFSLIVILVTLFFAIIRARRGLILICSSQIIFACLLYIFNSKSIVFNIISVVFISIFLVLFISEISHPERSKLFSFLIERGTEDTRTGVELYFYDDMKSKDWIIGKGMRGEYFCPNIDENDIKGYRDVIETGYLQTILKGGIVKLVLLLLIAIPAIFKGLFYSKNSLTKASGLWVLSWVLYLYQTITEAFSLYYLIVWISIGICYSKEIRNMSESSIRNYFTNKI